MAFRSLNQLRALRLFLMRLRNAALRALVGVDIDWDTEPSLSSRFAPGGRGLIAVGPETLISFKTLMFTTDPVSGEDRPIRIGARCFIGGGSMILPGVTIGEECIVGAGAVVFDDVPPRSIVVGNPARILRRNIEVGRFGRFRVAADDASRPVETASPDSAAG